MEEDRRSSHHHMHHLMHACMVQQFDRAGARGWHWQLEGVVDRSINDPKTRGRPDLRTSWCFSLLGLLRSCYIGQRHDTDPLHRSTVRRDPRETWPFIFPSSSNHLPFYLLFRSSLGPTSEANKKNLVWAV